MTILLSYVILSKRCKCAGVAQLVEQLICNQQVRGSSPFTSSNMEEFPSGQREQTVNLSAMPSVVRIHPLPPKALKALQIGRFKAFYFVKNNPLFALLRSLNMKLFSKPKYPKNHPIKQVPSTEPSEYQLEQINRKFGMFIHFGINTFNNVEWSNGKLPIESYCPTDIDADGWVKAAYEAGMNYVIIIAKHHDGFCLWNTYTTTYGVRNSPNKTDVISEVAKACNKYGIKLGIYYSLWDRHEHCYKNDEAYINYMEKQLVELLDGRYGEVVELWLDGGWDKPCRKWQLDRIYNTVKKLQPKCQIGVNLTIGKFTDKKGVPKKRYQPKNYQYGDPIAMFPSDFRLWDPHMCREDDPKIYTFNGEKYYLPFEQTICSRKEGVWFYSDEYENKTLQDADETAKNYRILEKAHNLMVINLPPDKNGKLSKNDVDNLMLIAEKLGIRR